MNESIELAAVKDGDTVVVVDNGESVTLELAYIDAPEREQPMGREAKQYWQARLKGKSFHFETAEADAPKVVLFVDDEPVNLELIDHGLAWPAQDIRDAVAQFDANERWHVATQKQIGIWGLEHNLRVSPWTWRAQSKEPVKTGRSEYLRWKQTQKAKEGE